MFKKRPCVSYEVDYLPKIDLGGIHPSERNSVLTSWQINQVIDEAIGYKG
ncbi:MAG: hypothetical protein AABX53_00135 [Nanoarchaeota archaeon]